ncbi:sarcoplasmic/endoplasmic reticulum calcium ATPase regulator DWORF [Pipra filicauda]|uniref:Sarcoplasmic/endoplasmic reticulum calcium ATPase regulator DWORF n=1 Tax=Pipra filicauda TaxID=649802 RepID=A0A7R5L6B1_9PASS|nr:sarcoplasmic/endoplasmic reticulum calcium ATPase regulator DWORF [Pipra filicauda]
MDCKRRAHPHGGQCQAWHRGHRDAGGPWSAPAPLSRLVVPVLLALGWLLGCALMVYIVFS